MKSEIIQAVFKDELERTKRLISRYEKEAENLPKGSIYARKIANQEYFYLSYRDAKKQFEKFLSPIYYILAIIVIFCQYVVYAF